MEHGPARGRVEHPRTLKTGTNTGSTFPLTSTFKKLYVSLALFNNASLIADTYTMKYTYKVMTH